jgi:tRNA(His) guanylyltransferase
MNAAAKHTLHVITDIVFAYGVSDEFSFVFSRDTQLFERRREKLVSTVVSTFTAAYVFYWREYFGTGNGRDEEGGGVDGEATTASGVDGQSKRPAQPLDPMFLPTFDARAILYPTTANLRDYLNWRQVDCHINNLYNTTFWALVLKGGMTEREAEERLKGTVAADKNEILFGTFGVNYNNEGAMERKGSCVVRDSGGENEAREDGGDGGQVRFEGRGLDIGESKEMSKTQKEKMRKARQKVKIVVEHVDIIKDEFWEKRPWILGGKAMR